MEGLLERVRRFLVLSLVGLYLLVQVDRNSPVPQVTPDAG